jgi:hypothetical protein
MKYFVILLCLFVFSCQEECNPESTRCQGEIVQLCNSDGNWYDVQDCVLVNPGLWECCVTGVEYETIVMADCVPIDSCEIDGGVE